MDRAALVECAEEASAYFGGPTPEVTAATRAVRRVRADQLDEVFAAVGSGAFIRAGYRSPTDWLAGETNESIGQCKHTVHLAHRIQVMPAVRAAFRNGDLAEAALRLLAEAWHADIADVFARDEHLLLGWAVKLSNKDFKMVLDTWRTHADPDREERTTQERYDQRNLHLSRMLDDMGRLDATLDPEGFAIVREAIRAVSHKTDHDERTATQRRADGLVTIAKIALTHLEPEAGKKRRRPRVIATITHHDLTNNTSGGSIDTNHDRIVVPAETIRRVACDATIHRYITDPAGTVIDYGRGRRTVSDTQYDRLVIRDHGCRVSGCGAPAAGCDNLLLLCWHHHHWLHEQHWSIEPHGAGHFTLTDTNGREHTLRPPMVGLTLPQQAVLPGTTP